MPPYAAAVFVFCLDRLSKTILLNRMSPGDSLPVIPNIFHLTLVMNKGIAFGLFSGRLAPLLPYIAAITIIALLAAFYFSRRGISGGVIIPLIIGGAAGNMTDRLRYGCVIYFLDFRIWPVFNIADSAITIGAVLLAWNIIKNQKQIPNI